MRKLFKAHIYHKRFLPTINEFIYGGFFIQFSLSEMNELKSKLFGVNSFNLFSFYTKDHGDRIGGNLQEWAKKTLKEAGVSSFNGKIVLQTFPRVLGYVFNPVSFWFCYEEEEVLAIICQVNNTFGESHSYVLKNKPCHNKKTLKKKFHVSPFYDVKGDYEFDFTTKNIAKIIYKDDGVTQLITSIKGTSIHWSDLSLLRLFFQFPLYTLFVIFAVHYQALKLFIKKNKFYTKPEKPINGVSYEQTN